MEEIEYLEEYEDIVLPAINSAAAVAASNASKSTANIDDEGSSSSLDQDIFNCLFDDNSDDDNDEQHQPKSDETNLNQKRESRPSLDSIDLLNDLGEQVAKEFELKKTVAAQHSSQKNCGSTKKSSFTARPKTLVTKNSGTFTPKSVATVRPTVQNKEIQKKSHIARQSSLGRQQPRKSTASASLTSPKTNITKPLFPVRTRKPLPTNTPTTPSPSSSITKRLIATPPSKPTLIKQRPATIVKPEKIVTKDPPEDPLNLDELSTSESANYSVSDISGETYNSISDFDDDDYDFTSHIENLDDEDDESSNSQIIDISNDSTGSRSQFEDLRTSTPSPVVSDDRDLYNTSGSRKQRPSSPRLMANHEIIKSLLTKGEKPKLLQLINEHDNVDNIDSEDEERPTKSESTKMPIGQATTPQKELLNEQEGVTSITYIPSSQITSYKSKQQGDTSKTINVPAMDYSNNSRDIQSPGNISHDSYLSVVNEMLEESYAEAMKNSKHEVLPNQEVGAEMEISVEETTETDFCGQDQSESTFQEQVNEAEEQQSPAGEETKILEEKDKQKGLKLTDDSSNVNAVVLAEKHIREDEDEDEETNVLCAESTSETKHAVKTIESSTDVNDNKSTEMGKESQPPKAHTNKSALEDGDFSQDTLDDENGFQGFHDDGQQSVTKIEISPTDANKTNTGDEQKEASTSKMCVKKLPAETFKNPSKKSDISKEKSSNKNSSRESSIDRSRESLAKLVTDVPRGVIRNPFVQRTANKNSKDGGSRASSKDRPRAHSSGEHSRETSRDRSKDFDDNSRFGPSEANLSSKQKSNNKPSVSRGTIKTDSKEFKNSDNDKDKKDAEVKSKVFEKASKEIQSPLRKKQEAADKKNLHNEPLGRIGDQSKKHSIPKETKSVSLCKEQSKSNINVDMAVKTTTDSNEEKHKEITKSIRQNDTPVSHESGKETKKAIGCTEDKLPKELGNKSLARVEKAYNESNKVNKTPSKPTTSKALKEMSNKSSATIDKACNEPIKVNKTPSKPTTSKVPKELPNKSSTTIDKTSSEPIKVNKAPSKPTTSKDSVDSALRKQVTDSSSSGTGTSKPTSGVSNTLQESKKTSGHVTKSLKDESLGTERKKIKTNPSSNTTKLSDDRKVEIKTIARQKVDSTKEKLKEKADVDKGENTTTESSEKVTQSIEKESSRQSELKTESTPQTELKDNRHVRSGYGKSKPQEESKGMQIEVEKNPHSKMVKDITNEEKKAKDVTTGISRKTIIEVKPNKSVDVKKQQKNTTKSVSTREDVVDKPKKQKFPSAETSPRKDEKPASELETKDTITVIEPKSSEIIQSKDVDVAKTIPIMDQKNEKIESENADATTETKTEENKVKPRIESSSSENKPPGSVSECIKNQKPKNKINMSRELKVDDVADKDGDLNEANLSKTVEMEKKTKQGKNIKNSKLCTDVQNMEKTSEDHQKADEKHRSSDISEDVSKSTQDIKIFQKIISNDSKVMEEIGIKTENVNATISNMEEKTDNLSTKEEEKQREVSSLIVRKTRNKKAGETVAAVADGTFSNTDKECVKKTESDISNLKETVGELEVKPCDSKQKEVPHVIVRKTRNKKVDETDGASNNTEKECETKVFNSKEIEGETEPNSTQINSRKTRSIKLDDSTISTESKEESTASKKEADNTHKKLTPKLMAHSANTDDVIQQTTSLQINTSVTNEPEKSNSSVIDDSKSTIVENEDYEIQDCNTDSPKRTTRKTRSAACDTITEETKSSDPIKCSKSHSAKGEDMLSKLAQRNTRKTRNIESTSVNFIAEVEREETLESKCLEVSQSDDISQTSESNKKCAENVTNKTSQSNSKRTRTAVETQKDELQTPTPELKCLESQGNVPSISSKTNKDVTSNVSDKNVKRIDKAPDTVVHPEGTTHDNVVPMSSNTSEESVTIKESCRTKQSAGKSVDNDLDESQSGLKHREMVTSKTSEDVVTKKSLKNTRGATDGEIDMSEDLKMEPKSVEAIHVDLPTAQKIDDNIAPISSQNNMLDMKNTVATDSEESELSKTKTTEFLPGRKTPQGGRHRQVKERKCTPGVISKDFEKRKSKIEKTVISKESQNVNEESETPNVKTMENMEEIKDKLTSSDARETKNDDTIPSQPIAHNKVLVARGINEGNLDMDGESSVSRVGKEFIVKEATRSKLLEPPTTSESLDTSTLTENPKDMMAGDSSSAEKSAGQDKTFSTKQTSNNNKPTKARATPENVETPTLLDDTKDFEGYTSNNEKADIAERTRKLRKRGTESPFPTNASSNKESFKQPPKVFSPGHVSSASKLGTTMKRRLRSPAPEAGTQSPIPKRPKIDKTRLRDIQSEISVTVNSKSAVRALPISSSKQTPIPSPRRPLHKQPVNVHDRESFESLVHIKEVALNSNIEEVVRIKSAHKNVTEIEDGNANVKEDTEQRSQTEGGVEASTSKGLSDEVNKGNQAQKAAIHKIISSNKKVNLPDKKKTKQSPDKNKTQHGISSPEKSPGCNVLSFAEWLKNNNRKEATQEQQNPSENDQADNKGRRRPTKPTSSSHHLDSQATAELLTEQNAVPALQPSVASTDQTPVIRANETSNEVPSILGSEILHSHGQVSVAQEIVERVTQKTNQAKATEPDIATVRGDEVYSTTEDNITVEHTTNTNEDSLTQAPNSSLKSRSRSKMRRRVFRRKGLNKTTRQVTPKNTECRTPSLSPTKQDKAKGKRTEIDILIESMSKEMKDGGIENLLNTRSHVKRQRVSSKRITTVESANTTDANITSVSDVSLAERSVNNTPTVAEISEMETKKVSVVEISQKPPIRRPQSQGKRKSTVSKEVVGSSEQSLSIEMEKALIDEVELRNMNTSLLEPLKCGSVKEHQQNAKSKTLTFKTPKPPEKIVNTMSSKIQSVECPSKLYGEISNKSFKCRKFKVKLNRSLVKKYCLDLNKQAILNPVVIKSAKSESIRHFRRAPRSPVTTSGNPTNSSVIHNKTSTDLRIQAVVSSAKLVAMSPLHSGIGSTVEGNNREVNKDTSDSTVQVSPASDTRLREGGIQAQSTSMQASLSTPAEAGEISSIMSQTENAGGIGKNGRQRELLANIVTEPTVPVEFKNEFLDENPNSLDDAILPDTPTLMARAHSITQAAANALSNTIMPTDIRLLTNDPMSTSTYVPSFGVTPTLVDTRGTRMYTFLHPAKYSRNHGNVLLDYCCPNLDGPMPAIDPTRIHAQIQTPVIEVPAYIVLTTKVVTRAELESNSSKIPDIIRKKADKLRSSIAMHQNVSTSPGTQKHTVPVMPQTLQPRPPQLQQQSGVPVMRPPHLSPAPHFSPALNALTKYLPSTTTITAKIRPTHPQSSLALSLPHPNTNQTSEVSVVPKGSPLLNDMQLNLLRSNLRRIDVIFKKLVQPFDKLNFAERHQIIDNLIVSGKFLPKDLDRTIVLMEEYLKQINSIQMHQMVNYTTPVTATPSAQTHLPSIQMPPLQPAPNLAASPSAYKTNTSQQQVQQQQQQQVNNTAIRKVQATMKQHNTTVNTTTIKQRQVPIYDTERNIIGYQLQVTNSMPAYTKSTMSSTTSGGIMSSSLGGNTSAQKKAVKRPAQDSPRVFYTSQPLHTSTPKANLNTPTKNTHKGAIVTTVRSAGPTSAGTETITTTTTATVKRVTRSRAAGSKIIIVSKSNSNEETILPDVSHQAEIKNEKDVEDFIG